jgi:hypothetical protein
MKGDGYGKCKAGDQRMSWVKVDDQSTFNEKVLALGNEGWGALVRLTTWSSAQLSDGVVPRPVALLIAGSDDVIGRMVAAGMLEVDDDAYRIVSYLKYNPSREEVEGRREQERVRKLAAREAAMKRRAEREASGQRPGAVRPESARTPTGTPAGFQADGARIPSGHPPDSNGCPTTPTRPVPSRPVPTTPKGVMSGQTEPVSGQGATGAPLSADEQAVLDELRRCPALASVAKPALARAWWGSAVMAGRKRADVLASIAWAGSQAATAEADGTPKTHEDIRDHVAKLVVSWRGEKSAKFGGEQIESPTATDESIERAFTGRRAIS